jgi:biotin transport system substrate-specific component
MTLQPRSRYAFSAFGVREALDLTGLGRRRIIATVPGCSGPVTWVHEVAWSVRCLMIAQLTVADVIRPSEKGLALAYDVFVVLAGSALIALCTQIAFGQPIPVTGQTFAVLLVGATLGARRGALSVIAYIVGGLMGLPVFAQGNAGVVGLTGLTGGYLIGFVAAAWLVGALAQRGWDRRPATTVLAMIVGNVVLYCFGLAWLVVKSQVTGVLAVGLYPFLLGDAIKIALATAVLPSTWKIFHHFRIDKMAKMC